MINFLGNIAALGFLLWLLFKASEISIKSILYLAQFLKVSEYTIAFILMGFLTSLPEFFIAIQAGIQEIGSLSLGNIIGANIINILFIVGIVAIIQKGFNPREDFFKDGLLILALLSFSLILGIDGHISKLEGLFLIIAFLSYIGSLVQKDNRLSHELPGESPQTIPLFLKNLGRFAIGIILLLSASWGITYLSAIIIKSLSLEALAFGALILGIGTTMPELVFSIQSMKLKHPSLTIGNIMGSLAINVSLIVGASALIYPITVANINHFIISGLAMLLSFGVIFVFYKTGSGKIGQKEGWIMIALYIIFAILQINFLF